MQVLNVEEEDYNTRKVSNKHKINWIVLLRAGDNFNSYRCNESVQKLCPEEKLFSSLCQLYDASFLFLIHAGVCRRYRSLFSSLQKRPQLFPVVQCEKQPPQCEIIHHSKYDYFIRVRQTFCFFIVPCKVLSITQQPRATTEISDRNKSFKKPVVHSYSSHPGLLFLSNVTH